MLRLLGAIYFKIPEEHLDAWRATVISQQPDEFIRLEGHNSRLVADVDIQIVSVARKHCRLSCQPCQR